MQALFVLGNGEGIYMYLPVFRELIIEISWPSKIIHVIHTIHVLGISNHRREKLFLFSQLLILKSKYMEMLIYIHKQVQCLFWWTLLMTWCWFTPHLHHSADELEQGAAEKKESRHLYQRPHIMQWLLATRLVNACMVTSCFSQHRNSLELAL